MHNETKEILKYVYCLVVKFTLLNMCSFRSLRPSIRSEMSITNQPKAALPTNRPSIANEKTTETPAAAPAAMTSLRREVVVSCVVDPCHLYVQLAEAGLNGLDE